MPDTCDIQCRNGLLLLSVTPCISSMIQPVRYLLRRVSYTGEPNLDYILLLFSTKKTAKSQKTT